MYICLHEFIQIQNYLYNFIYISISLHNSIEMYINSLSIWEPGAPYMYIGKYSPGPARALRELLQGKYMHVYVMLSTTVVT